jgi:CBS domain-containing protein
MTREVNMSKVSDILANKSGSVVTIGENQSVLDATRIMNEHKIGALVVTDGEGHVVGIFTERDVLRRIVAEQKDPGSTVVAVAMTSNVIVCEAGMSLEDCRQLMRNKRIRHLPVVDGQGKLQGMVSIGDLNAQLANNHEIQIKYLSEYIHGRA